MVQISTLRELLERESGLTDRHVDKLDARLNIRDRFGLHDDALTFNRLEQVFLGLHCSICYSSLSGGIGHPVDLVP
jgi:hypothetical protein